jgi:hypothetical protein
MSTVVGIEAPKLSSKKNRISLHIRQIDNGFVLNVNKDTKEGYEDIELAITSLPKLLKAVGTFLRENSPEKEED